jgi:hypothetical protein
MEILTCVISPLPKAGVWWRSRKREGRDSYLNSSVTLSVYLTLLSLSFSICNVKIEADTSWFVEYSKYNYACKYLAD